MPRSAGMRKSGVRIASLKSHGWFFQHPARACNNSLFRQEKEPGLTRHFFSTATAGRYRTRACLSAIILSPAGDATMSTQTVTDVASCPTQIDNIL